MPLSNRAIAHGVYLWQTNTMSSSRARLPIWQTLVAAQVAPLLQLVSCLNLLRNTTGHT
ncbi:Uncharacterised protein [Vibrio cholerae]|nr:Uncharacterised protein [Vibrio cholerae]